MQSISPTIRCKYCQKPAQRVCSNPKCDQYPFLCSKISKCLKGKNISYGLHKKCEQQTPFFTLEQFWQRVDMIQTRFSEQHLDKVKTWLRGIKEKLSDLVSIYLYLLEQQLSPPKLNAETQMILSKIRRPSGTPNVKGRQIYTLTSSDTVFDEEDFSFKIIKDYQQEFKSLMYLIDQLLESSINRYKECGNYLQEGSRNVSFKENEIEVEREMQIEMNAQDVEEKPVQYIQIMSDTEEQKIVYKYLREGRQLFENKQYEKAIKLLQKGLEQGHKNWQIYLLLGHCTFQKPPPYYSNEIIDSYYNKSLTLKQQNPEAYNGLGAMYIYKEMYTQSLKQFKKALEYKTDPTYYRNQGVSYFQLKQYRNAAQSFTKAIEIQKNQNQLAQCYDFRLSCYRQLGYSNKAKQDEDVIKKLKQKMKTKVENYQQQRQTQKGGVNGAETKFNQYRDQCKIQMISPTKQ